MIQLALVGKYSLQQLIFFHEWNKNYSQEGAWELTKDNLVIPEEYLTT